MLYSSDLSSFSIGIVGNPLGLASRAIPDSSMTASSEFNSNHSPWRGRLNLEADSSGAGAWVVGRTNADQWIQVCLIMYLYHYDFQ